MKTAEALTHGGQRRHRASLVDRAVLGLHRTSNVSGQGGSLDGDRQGFLCGYRFIAEAAMTFNYMKRHLDGTVANEGGTENSEDCIDGLWPVDYQGVCRPVHERARIGFFGDVKASDIWDGRTLNHESMGSRQAAVDFEGTCPFG